MTRWGDRPMPFACAVALSGRFGIDLDLDSISRSEETVLGRAVGVARRTQDVVQRGRVRRLVSPVDGPDRSRAAWSFTSGDRTVLFAYQLEEPGSPPPVLSLRHLTDSGDHVLWTTDLDGPDESRTLTPAALAAGIEWPLTEPLTARIWEIRRLTDQLR